MIKVAEIKEYILFYNKIEEILTDIGCHHIKKHKNLTSIYYTCGNYDGDNPTAISVYESQSINVVNYTRNITDGLGNSDIVNLICYNKKFTFIEAVRYLCDFLGINYNSPDIEEDDYLSRKDKLNKLSYDVKDNQFEVSPVINEDILKLYEDYSNDIFEREGISLEIQNEFGIGYDFQSNRITIPIRNSTAELVGVKGRLYKQTPDYYNPKYIYLQPCIKSTILYGFYDIRVRNAIQDTNTVYIFESEKSCLIMYSHGIFNCVAIGGHEITAAQIDPLLRMGVNIVFCYDKDIPEEHYTKEANKIFDMRSNDFDCLSEETIKSIENRLYYMFDKDDKLLEKEAPCDRNLSEWGYLKSNNIYKININQYAQI